VRSPADIGKLKYKEITVTQINIRFPENFVKQLDTRSDPGKGGMSEAVRSSLERYFFLIESARQEIAGEFTSGEVSLLVDICNGTWFEPPVSGAVLANAEDAESIYYKRWEVDRGKLLAKLKAITICQEMALIDAIERFWVSVSKNRTLEQPRPGDALR
jgi:hypothetical protein